MRGFPGINNDSIEFEENGNEQHTKYFNFIFFFWQNPVGSVCTLWFKKTSVFFALTFLVGKFKKQIIISCSKKKQLSHTKLD